MTSTSKNDKRKPNLKKKKKRNASTVPVKVKEEIMDEKNGTTNVVNGVGVNNSDSSDLDEYKSRPDVLKRRSKRLKHLAKVYKDYYWALIEELKTKHRDYVWNFGISPSHEHPQGSSLDNHNTNHALVINNISNSNGNGVGAGNGNCEVHSCKKKAMALTRFCHAHILSDANQVLYKGCKYPTKRYNTKRRACSSTGSQFYLFCSPSGPTLCMKPIIKSAVPSLCSNHLEKAEKHLSRCLRKEGFTGSGTNKQPLKFNVVVAEFVRQIQSKRKENL